VSFSPDGKLLATAEFKGPVRFWEVATGRMMSEVSIPWVSSFAFAPEGNCFVTGDGYGLVKTWEISTGREIASCDIELPPFKAVRQIVFFPDENRLAAGSDDGTIRILDVAASREIGVFKHGECTLTSVSVSPDGQHIASTGVDRKVNVWEVDTGKKLWSSEVSATPMYFAIFSPDGRRLATTSWHQTAIRRVDTGEIEGKLGSEDWGTSLSRAAFTVDGHYLITGDVQGNVKSWGLGGREKVTAFVGHGKSWRMPSIRVDHKNSSNWDGPIQDGLNANGRRILLLT